MDYGVMATVLVSQFADKQFQMFIIDLVSWDLNDFCVMVQMRFFALTGDRYQMVVPENLDMERVKQATSNTR
jgi:hypothetical protein